MLMSTIIPQIPKARYFNCVNTISISSVTQLIVYANTLRDFPHYWYCDFTRRAREDKKKIEKRQHPGNQSLHDERGFFIINTGTRSSSSPLFSLAIKLTSRKSTDDCDMHVTRTYKPPGHPTLTHAYICTSTKVSQRLRNPRLHVYHYVLYYVRYYDEYYHRIVPWGWASLNIVDRRPKLDNPTVL